MWALAFASGVSVLYILDPVNINAGVKEFPTTAMSVLYGGFHRIAWTFTLGWVIFACFHGYGGINYVQYGNLPLSPNIKNQRSLSNKLGFLSKRVQTKAKPK